MQAHRIGMPDSFIEHGTAADQRRQLQLDAEGIAQRVLSVFFPEAGPAWEWRQGRSRRLTLPESPLRGLLRVYVVGQCVADSLLVEQ